MRAIAARTCRSVTGEGGVTGGGFQWLVVFRLLGVENGRGEVLGVGGEFRLVSLFVGEVGDTFFFRPE